MLANFFVQYQQVAFIDIATRKRPYALECYQACGDKYKFYEFCLKAQIYHWTQILSVVFLEVTNSLCKFSRKRLPNTQLWITELVNHFSKLKKKKKRCLMKKMASSVYNSIIQVLFLKITIVFQSTTKVLYAYFLSVIQNIKKICTQW